MVGVGDENEVEDDRRYTPPPPPTVFHAIPSPPPAVSVMAGVNLSDSDNPRRTSTPSASPTPSASKEEGGPLEDDAVAAWRHAEAGQRLPGLNLSYSGDPRRTSTPSASPTPSVSEEEGDPLEEDAAAAWRHAEAGPRLPVNNRCSLFVAVSTLYSLDEQQDRFSAGDESRPGHIVSQSASKDESIATDVSSAFDSDGDGTTRARLQSTVIIFRQWAANRAPHLLQYLEVSDHLALEEDQGAGLALVDGKGGNSEDNLVEDIEKVGEQDAIHPRDGTTSDIAAEDQEKVGSTKNVDALEGHGYVVQSVIAIKDENSDAYNDQEALKQCVIDKENADTAGHDDSDKDHEVVEQSIIEGMLASKNDIAMDMTGSPQVTSKGSCFATDVQLRAACDVQLVPARDDQLRATNDEGTDDISSAREKVMPVSHCDTYGLGTTEISELDDDDQEVVEQCVIDREATSLKDLKNEAEVCTCHEQIGAPCAEGPIEITITENIDVEVIGKKFETTNICGKMVVQFPPEIDRCVHFVVDRVPGIDYTAYPRTDREFFNKCSVLKSERFPERFDILKWKKKNGYTPTPLSVTVEVSKGNDEHMKDCSMKFIVITCRVMDMIPLQNVVVTVPVPRMDHFGVPKRTRTHIFETLGTHLELENRIEWHIPCFGAMDGRPSLSVDAFCYDGWQAPSQFHPVKIEFSYEQSFGSKVAQVLRTGVGRDVEFQQFTVGRYSLTIHIETERARRAAEAAAAELAWPFEEPWEDWEEEEAAAEPWEDWEDEEAAADEDNFD